MGVTGSEHWMARFYSGAITLSHVNFNHTFESNAVYSNVGSYSNPVFPKLRTDEDEFSRRI
jgi:hypothetical protein